jgi:energy-coupling factor transporter transmembrane protein EcfT
MLDKFNKLCDPAKLYLFMVILFIVVGLFSKINILAIIVKLIFALIWTFVLNWLCKKGYKTVSWILVLLPFILLIIAFFGYVKMSRGNQMLSAMQMTSK